MKIWNLCRLIVWMLLSLTAVRGDVAQAKQDFADAMDAYDSGEFAAAHAKLSQIVDQYVSLELFMNLGNTAYRTGDASEAAVWYRRALVLERKLPEARQNLRFLKRRLGFLDFEDGVFDQVSGVLSMRAWRLFCAFGFGAAAIGVAALLFLPIPRERVKTVIWIAAVAMLVGAGASVGCWAGSKRRPALSVYVVTEGDTTALAAPNGSAGRVVALPQGSELAYLEQRGAWIYAEIPGGSRGWVQASRVEKLWPYSVRLIE